MSGRGKIDLLREHPEPSPDHYSRPLPYLIDRNLQPLWDELSASTVAGLKTLCSGSFRLADREPGTEAAPIWLTSPKLVGICRIQEFCNKTSPLIRKGFFMDP